jgi:hypothetical protein
MTETPGVNVTSYIMEDVENNDDNDNNITFTIPRRIATN